MKSIFKKESLIMTLVLIFYGFIAGGSVDSMFDPVFWKLLFNLYFWETAIPILLFIFIIVIIIYSIRISIKNEKKRLQLKKEFESQEKDMDLSDNMGDDRIGLYFDNNKEKALIISISTNGINKYYIDDFKKYIAKSINKHYCAIDIDRRKAILARYEEKIDYKVIEYDNKDNNKNEVVSHNIPTLFDVAYLKHKKVESIIKPTFILIEEKYGYISVFKDLSVKSFNYIKKDFISKKTGDVSYITKKTIGSYVFLMDDYFKVLVIISPLISSEKILNYSDIVNVTYEEDGNTLFSKSMKRTIGGAIVGDILMGGAGAIVGGLSGDTSQNKKVQSMNIKILVRSTITPSVNLPINLMDETFNTRDKKSKETYSTRIKEANEIKDLISVIIDSSNQQSSIPATSTQKIEEPKQKTSIADELVKLAQLKDAGILSEEEFQEQKKKILN